MNAPMCSVKDCGADAAIAALVPSPPHGEEVFSCARHARSMPALVRSFARPLIRPLVDLCVILRDPPEEYRGRIIIPDVARDRHGRINRGAGRGENFKGSAYEYSSGIILAMGPGYQRRTQLGGAYTHGRKPMGAVRVGQHVMFRSKFEAEGSLHEWRGLALVHAFDVLGEYENEAAAQ